MGMDIFAPSIFLGGCNLRCPYCINCKLIKTEELNLIDISCIENYIKENNCEWINISGGEPTCSGEEALTNLIKTVKSWDCKVGMATNGVNSLIIKNVVQYLDYVALDIKTLDQEQYASINVSEKDPLTQVLISQSYLIREKNKRNTFDYEIRTTLFPPFIDKKAIQEISTIIEKGDKWVLQRFRNNTLMLDMNCQTIIPYNNKEIEELVEIAKGLSDQVFVRDV